MASEHPLQISYQDLRTEVDSFTTLAARDFLSSESYGRLARYGEALDTLYNGAARGGFVDWEVPQDAPLCTSPSDGDYDRHAAARSVHGEMTGRCRIKRVGKMLEFDDASTELKIVETLDSGREVLGAWRFDIAVPTSPGCFFHVKAEGQIEFPCDFPVPRLPGLPMTPLAALEFLIGELFQSRWPQHVDGDRREVLAWRAVQRRRFWNYFNEVRGLMTHDRLTPMALLKNWKPPDGAFFERKVF